MGATDQTRAQQPSGFTVTAFLAIHPPKPVKFHSSKLGG